MPKWEYMTWWVLDLAFKENQAAIVYINGRQTKGKKLGKDFYATGIDFYDELVRAGLDEWEVVGVEGQKCIFKRPLAEPPVVAPPPKVLRWEYQQWVVQDLSSAEAYVVQIDLEEPKQHPKRLLVHMLSRAGDEGWEMVTTQRDGDSGIMLFKRQLPGG